MLERTLRAEEKISNNCNYLKYTVNQYHGVKMKTDYNEASTTYDNTRKSNEELIDLFNNKMNFTTNMNILDFGCGTGNYLLSISNKFQSNCFGVEPSDGMIEKALVKNPGLSIKKGDHIQIPFEDGFFDFIYMTDVIHHVPDLDKLFETLNEKLKENGKICIVTESHDQIKSRWYNKYFKSLVTIEQKRYPDISKIIINANKHKLVSLENKNKLSRNINIVDDYFIKMVEEKNYSMFRLLEEKEFNEGLIQLKSDKGKSIVSEKHGETLVWLQKMKTSNN